MNDNFNDWDIGRTGRNWTGPEGLAKLDRLPGRLEMAHGKLCFNEAERHTLLAGLLENVGLDEVLKLGRLQDWEEAIAERAKSELERPALANGEAPERYWNCRVIEFPSDEETWYAIHEVHYWHGRPCAYTAEPAALGWISIDDPGGASNRLERFREALRKPYLKASDFEGAGFKAELLDKLVQMIEQSGGVRDVPSLSAWLDSWLAEPLQELGGATPSQALQSEDGRRDVETLLERMRGGLPG